MVRFDSEVAFELETRSADRLGEARGAASRGPSRKSAEPKSGPSNQLADHILPQWARLGAQRKCDPDAELDASFSAGAGLALLDAVLRTDPPFAGALRQRLALRAATASASIMRLREDEGGLRDAEHLAAPGADPGPAGRLHRLWRRLASKPARLDAEGLRAAAELLRWPQAIDTLAPALKNLARENRNPLAAAVQAAAFALRALTEAPCVDAEILALWAADLVLAERLGWRAPVPLIATRILHPSLRAASGRRARPDDPDWAQSCTRAYALAAQEAYALAGDLARRSDKLLSLLPKLRAKRAGRVVELLLADDAVTPAVAARAAGLSDRAARRLFDRLVELKAVRELSGRPSFRVYGL